MPSTKPLWVDAPTAGYVRPRGAAGALGTAVHGADGDDARFLAAFERLQVAGYTRPGSRVCSTSVHGLQVATPIV